jgi:hypothetical protein
MLIAVAIQAALSPPTFNQIQSNTPTFAPRPTQSAALSNAPVLQHTTEEEEPEVIKCVPSLLLNVPDETYDSKTMACQTTGRNSQA